MKPVHTLLANRYYIDYFYERIIVGRVLYGGVGVIAEFVDTHVVDRTGNFVGAVGRNVGRLPGAMQNGQVQAYSAVISVGLVLLLGAFWIWG
jgi:NADH:ubiquinone oxidoreductase subunit 5 (subunit L)/multisubunit Na+/H+ antiporter MnhA subunit